jgi:hypothetical protein
MDKLNTLPDTWSSPKSLRRYLASVIGISQVTEQNMSEVWARVFIQETALGTHDLESRLTFEDIRKSIGLSVADGATFGSAEFMKRIGNRLRERAYRLQRGRTS